MIYTVDYPNFDTPVSINTAGEIDGMRVAGKFASEVLDFYAPHVKPNVTTDELDPLFHASMVEERTLRHVIKDVGGPSGIKLEVKCMLLANGLKPLPGNNALCRHAIAIFGEPMETTGTPLYTNARLFCERGIPEALRPRFAHVARPAALNAKPVPIAWHSIFSVDPKGSPCAGKHALHASIHRHIT